MFDPETYPPELQPLWAKLAALPDDADEALEFWMEDGSQSQRLTDIAPKGKWNRLMKARIIQFELPEEWGQKIEKFENKKQKKASRKRSSSSVFTLSAQDIIEARQRLGISQRGLAERMCKSQSWIRDVEKERFTIKPEDQKRLREILEIDQKA
jgi:DNA-binding transcriptional regulator YiaG